MLLSSAPPIVTDETWEGAMEPDGWRRGERASAAMFTAKVLGAACAARSRSTASARRSSGRTRARWHTLYPYKGLFTAMAAVSLVVELGAPLALLDRRLGRVWALGAFAMHWGILAVLGIRFRYQLSGVGFASWFDVERTVGRLLH